MRLTVYTDYALRLLMFLAASESGVTTIAKVSIAYGISANHLTKVVHQLAKGGYIETTRGRGGGIRLARPPSEIGLGDLVRYTEPDFHIVPCFRAEQGECPLNNSCKLKNILYRAKSAFFTVLSEFTVADLADNPALVALASGQEGLTAV